MLQLEKVGKSFGARSLFRDLSWTVSARERVALVGANGVGKSTLFRIIAGQVRPDEGEIHLAHGAALAYLPQEMDLDSETSVAEFIGQGAVRQRALEAKMRALEAEIERTAEREALERLTRAHGEAADAFRRAGGYALESTTREIMAGMGFEAGDGRRALKSFSGGWRMRALLARLLLGRPDVLLLDEPTNHLDVESIEWLESHLGGFEGAVLTITHDRAFLDRVATHIAELTCRGVDTYAGPYEAFERARAERRARYEDEVRRHDEEVARIEAFVEKFRYKATKAKQVQSRIKALDRLKASRPVAPPAQGAARVTIRFARAERSGALALEARAITKAYGDQVVLDGVDLAVRRGDRIALVGPNGAGKSTLMRILAGDLEPDAGEVTRDAKLALGYFAQHTSDALPHEATVLEAAVRAATREGSGRERDVLGAFGFSGDEAVSRRVATLSGGEKTRLALATFMLRPANCLLLDEPTNHLDLATRAALERALEEYEGAVCVISHDRRFLAALADRVVEVGGARLEQTEGGWSYYVERRARHQGGARDAEPGGELAADERALRGLSKREVRQAIAEARASVQDRLGPARRAVERWTGEVERGELRLAALEEALVSPEVLGDAALLAERSKEYAACQRALEEAGDAWLEACEACEAIEEELGRVEEELRARGA